MLILSIIIASLLIIAFFTIAERNLLVSIQSRNGPNVTGFWGVLQTFADGLNLLLNELQCYVISSIHFTSLYVNFPLLGNVTDNEICWVGGYASLMCFMHAAVNSFYPNSGDNYETAVNVFVFVVMVVILTAHNLYYYW